MNNMNEEDLKTVLDLENFIKKTRGNKIKIKQPTKLIYNDIFSEEEKKENIERKIIKNKNKLKSPKPMIIHKTKKYNIKTESIVFQELDSKKSIHQIPMNKEAYNNYLYNSIIKNKELNSNEINAFSTNYMRKKSAINLSDLYEKKVKNVRIIHIN